MNRAIRCLLLAMACTVASGQNDSPSRVLTLPEAIKLVTPWVVQIAYDMDEFPEVTNEALGRPFMIGPAGTGFVVNNDGYVITALHVLHFFDAVHGIPMPDGRVLPMGRNRLMIGIAVPNTDTGPLISRASFTLYQFSVVDKDDTHDLALLKPDQQLTAFGRPPIFRVSRPEDGQRVAVSGYPVKENVMITTSGTVASSWGFNTSQQLLPNGTKIPKLEDVFLVDMHVNHGNSGGPVYLVDTGAVIGVAEAYRGDDVMSAMPGGVAKPAVDSAGNPLMANAGLGVVTPARFVIALLKRNNVKWTEH